jgi:hypothetical protein
VSGYTTFTSNFTAGDHPTQLPLPGLLTAADTQLNPPVVFVDNEFHTSREFLELLHELFAQFSFDTVQTNLYKYGMLIQSEDRDHFRK